MQIVYDTKVNSVNFILNYIDHQRSKNPDFKVVDVGGSDMGWSKNHIDFLVDFKAENSDKSMSIDLCHYRDIQKLVEYAAENGQFDLLICSHTLEDLYNPFDLLDIIPQICKSAFISTPSANSELSHPEHMEWLGYIHHKWIFDVFENNILIVPKIPLLNRLVEPYNFKFNHSLEQINYFWSTGPFQYKIFMDNYLGPNPQTVINEYTNFLNRVQK